MFVPRFRLMYWQLIAYRCTIPKNERASPGCHFARLELTRISLTFTSVTNIIQPLIELLAPKSRSRTKILGDLHKSDEPSRRSNAAIVF